MQSIILCIYIQKMDNVYLRNYSFINVTTEVLDLLIQIWQTVICQLKFLAR